MQSMHSIWKVFQEVDCSNRLKKCMKNRISESSYNNYELEDCVFYRDGKDGDFKEGIITSINSHDKFQVKNGNSERIESRSDLWYYKDYRVDNDLLITHRKSTDSSSQTPNTPTTPEHSLPNITPEPSKNVLWSSLEDINANSSASESTECLAEVGKAFEFR